VRVVSHYCCTSFHIWWFHQCLFIGCHGYADKSAAWNSVTVYGLEERTSYYILLSAFDSVHTFVNFLLVHTFIAIFLCHSSISVTSLQILWPQKPGHSSLLFFGTYISGTDVLKVSQYYLLLKRQWKQTNCEWWKFILFTSSISFVWCELKLSLILTSLVSVNWDILYRSYFEVGLLWTTLAFLIRFYFGMKNVCMAWIYPVCILCMLTTAIQIQSSLTYPRKNTSWKLNMRNVCNFSHFMLFGVLSPAWFPGLHAGYEGIAKCFSWNSVLEIWVLNGCNSSWDVFELAAQTNTAWTWNLRQTK
jgi:hypothetical protein